MPRIQLVDPWGMGYQICTRAVETTLRAWFDEILPTANYTDHDGTRVWPRISVYPMWPLRMTAPDPRDRLAGADWLCDTRLIGYVAEFPAWDGDSGLRELLELRRRLERELSIARRRDGI